MNALTETKADGHYGIPTDGMAPGLAIMFNDRLYARCRDMALDMSKAEGFTPAHLLGKPYACFAVLTRAITWKLDPLAVAQSTYQTPGGKIGYEGKLVQAILENSGKFEGPMPLHTALAKSKNMVSIRILQAVGAQNAQEWITRFGFDAEKHPPYLTMALGAGSVTPMQMATAYAVFANGGHRVNPWLVARISDQKGKTLVEIKPPVLNASTQAIDARNAFIMSRLLQEVTRSGTAARAQATLKRPDLYGKTGTTNDSMDAWFAGFQPSLAAIVWIGYDNPRKLGDRETGGGLSLPVWIEYMTHALDCVHEMDTINHYVGMYPIASGGPVEKAYAPFLFALMAVMLLAFAVTLFYRVPALRTRSALQERADNLQEQEAEPAWDLG